MTEHGSTFDKMLDEMLLRQLRVASPANLAVLPHNQAPHLHQASYKHPRAYRRPWRKQLMKTYAAEVCGTPGMRGQQSSTMLLASAKPPGKQLLPSMG